VENPKPGNLHKSLLAHVSGLLRQPGDPENIFTPCFEMTPDTVLYIYCVANEKTAVLTFLTADLPIKHGIDLIRDRIGTEALTLNARIKSGTTAARIPNSLTGVLFLQMCSNGRTKVYIYLDAWTWSQWTTDEYKKHRLGQTTSMLLVKVKWIKVNLCL
jgi:hypothetical protein